jgi:oligogalacturonide transporter
MALFLRAGFFILRLYHRMAVSVLLFSGVFAVFGFARAGLYYIPWNIYSFIPDVDEIVTKKRREGIFAGVMVLTRKSTVALSYYAYRHRVAGKWFR